VTGPGVDVGVVSDSGVVERRVEGGDLLGAVARVLVGVTEVHLGAQGAGRAVRALLVVADEAATVKARKCRNPAGMRRSDPPAEPSAHAIAGDPERLVGHRGELVEVGAAVGGHALRRELVHQRTHALEELRAGTLLAHVRERQHGRATGPVEDVRRQHGIPAPSDPVGHLLDARAQPECIHHEQHAGMALALVRPGQIRVGDPVRGADLQRRAAHANRVTPAPAGVCLRGPGPCRGRSEVHVSAGTPLWRLRV
jgi:hypothetical protein